jgi:SAM-dependent methyltransferase
MALRFLRNRRSAYEEELSGGTTSARVFQDEYLRSIALEIINASEQALIGSMEVPPEPKVLEIGSAGGVTKKLRPGWTTSDIRDSEGVDFVFSGERLPISTESLDMIFAQDVLHHLDNLDRFLFEANRVLKTSGIVFCKEPYWGPLAQIVFRFLHPEDFKKRKVALVNSFNGPMAGNQALAWSICTESEPVTSAYLEKMGFRLTKVGPILGVAFLLSGGTTFTSAIPRRILGKLHAIEARFTGWLRFVGFGYLFYFRKIGSHE